MMTSPSIISVRRLRRRPQLKRRSIRDISREYLKFEHRLILAAELAVFAILTVIALWPVLNAAAVIRAHPL
jgi:hypothetical protein